MWTSESSGGGGDVTGLISCVLVGCRINSVGLLDYTFSVFITSARLLHKYPNLFSV
jgi:hypothetical protein